MRRQASVLGLAFVVVTAVGCQKVWGFEDFEEGPAAGGAAGGGVGGGSGGATGGAGGASGGAGGATGGAGGAAPCDDGAAPSGMIGVRIQDGSCVWIDPTEVTRAEYDTFRTGAPTNPSICSGNLSFDAPQEKQTTAFCLGPGETGDAGADAGTLAGELPVTCIDWCDALAFCTSAGKTLCPGKVNQPEVGAWFDVCSTNGANDYPYSGTYQANYCNDSTVSTKSLLAVGSKTECKTLSGVSDMVGNASEWLDACTGTGELDECDTRGGNFNDNSGFAACGGSVKVSKKKGLPGLGFRCCWLPK